jgi:hypothetical protein
MKKFLTTMFLICAAILLVCPQAGFAWNNVNQGCLAEGCHSATQVHGVTAHGFGTGNCAACHDGAGQKGNVLSSKCAGCHSNGEACPLIATPHGNPQACLACHTDCAPATTTTTTPANTTTTTPATTTTPPDGGIITIDPAEIEVDGTEDVTQDVKVTIDAEGLTEADLEGLEVSFSDACSEYITVNTGNYEISGQKVEGTVNITVKGDAPTTECTLTAKNTAGTIDVEATKFTITSTASPECQIKSISPSTVRVGFGILPRIKRFTFTFNIDVEAQGVTEDDIKLDTPNATIFAAKISGNTITVWSILRGLKPDTTYFFDVGECGRVSIETKGFF